MTTLEVLHPAGEVQKLADLQCNPVPSLQGRRLAILDNSKPNFQRLALLVGEQLQAERGINSHIAHFRKDNPAVGAKPELLDEIARSADLVLTGSAD
jgi:hypothetical protein